MSFEIAPFTPSMLSDAGTLLAQRHQRHRAARPELPSQFEDPAVARAAVEAVLRRDRAAGVAAVSGSRLLGYLIGDKRFDNVWGRSAWVQLAGCALAPGQDAELVRDLYAALAAPWVDFGVFNHFAMVPADEQALVHMWFALSFGLEKVHALLDLATVEPSPPPPPGVEIRRAEPRDRPLLEELSDVIWRHQVRAPDWGIQLPEAVADQRAGWGELAGDPDVTVWLAFYQGQVAGSQGYWRAETGADELLVPDQCLYLSVAGTREWARGLGIGRALTRHGLAQARAAGARFCLTDWRSSNLLASRFWPRQGFRPVAYRLARRVDPRIAWAGEPRA
ncbi:MAG TPA: GNAT family N-acetyltransferase [Ardenticatenaceae bacterium]|nr:GNAT family N-acetyltransferase [Ardenticatenaceae bacterium]